MTASRASFKTCFLTVGNSHAAKAVFACGRNDFGQLGEATRCRLLQIKQVVCVESIQYGNVM